MNLAFAGNIFSKMLYTDSFTGYTHSASAKDSDGAIVVSKNTTPAFIDQKCRVSFSQVDDPDAHTEVKNPVYHQIKIFCATTVPVLKGMRIVALHCGVTYEGYANQPQVHESHLEIEMVQKGAA